MQKVTNIPKLKYTKEEFVSLQQTYSHEVHCTVPMIDLLHTQAVSVHHRAPIQDQQLK